MPDGFNVPFRKGPVLSQAELLESQRVQREAQDSLPALRAMAEKWRNASSLSAAIAAAGAIIAAPERIANLPLVIRVIVLGVSIAGASFGLVSIVKSMLASFGWPKVLQLKTPLSLRLWQIEEVNRTVRRLRAARWTGIVSVIALIAAVLLVSFSPSSPVGIAVTTTKGVTICADSATLQGRTWELRTGSAVSELSARVVSSVRATSDC